MEGPSRRSTSGERSLRCSRSPPVRRRGPDRSELRFWRTRNSEPRFLRVGQRPSPQDRAIDTLHDDWTSRVRAVVTAMPWLLSAGFLAHASDDVQETLGRVLPLERPRNF